MPQGVAAVGARQRDRAQHLQEEDAVDRVDVLAQHLVPLGRPVRLAGEGAGLLRERGQFRRRREGPGEALGEGLASAVEDPGEAVGVNDPGIAVVRERGLESAA